MANDIDNDVVDAGDLVSVEAFTEIANAINQLLDSCPLGACCPIATGIPGVPTPNPTIWQLANGDPITEPLSPLFGQNTIDMRDRYLKGANNNGEVGGYGGSNTVSVQHSHTGFTEPVDPAELKGDNSNGYWSTIAHKHSITPDLPTAENFEPVHMTCFHYMRIR